jgi:hypothetical protein
VAEEQHMSEPDNFRDRLKWASGRVFGQQRVVAIEPMTRIEFSKHGCFATKHHASGKVEDIAVEDAMREFDQLAASGAFER